MSHKIHLLKDKKLAAIVKRQDDIVLSKKNDLFLELFINKKPNPADVIGLSFDRLKSIGLSTQKTTYVLNIADYFTKTPHAGQKLKKLSNEEFVREITCIKGVGIWTAEMILMFCLGREDVFSAGDYGIQTAMKKIYKLEDLPPARLKEKMCDIAQKWSPYRTYACMYLWRWKDKA